MRGMTPLFPEGHSRPIGRYTPGMAVTLRPGDRLVHVSGQVATDADGKLLFPNDASGQAVVVFDRLRATLAVAGASLGDLLSVTVFIADRRHFAAVSAVRDRMFRDHAPASTLIVAGMIEEGCLVEINGVAITRPPSGNGEAGHGRCAA